MEVPVLKNESRAYVVRKFLKEQRIGILSTHSQAAEQFPFGSVCPYMMDHQGYPVILISPLAEHTKNITCNDKVCLTVMDETKNPRLEGARVSLMANARKVAPEEADILARRYTRFFPEAKSYFYELGFHIYRLVPQRVRYIEGFGRIYWVEASELLLPPATLVDAEDGIIRHVNLDHPKTLLEYCQFYFDLTCKNAEMIAVDPEGFTLRAPTRDLYFPFEVICHGAEQVRSEMVRMARVSAAGTGRQ